MAMSIIVIQLGLFFLGTYLYTFGVNFFAKYRYVQIQLGSMLNIAVAIWTLFTNFYLFLAMIPLFFIFRRISSYLVYLLFKRLYPRSINLYWSTFLIRESYRENKDTKISKASEQSKGIEGRIDDWDKKNKEEEEYCSVAYKVAGVKEILLNYDESKESLKNIWQDIIMNYGGEFVSKAVIISPYYLNHYLAIVNKPGHFKTNHWESYADKLFFEISKSKEFKFIAELSESFGFPDTL